MVWHHPGLIAISCENPEQKDIESSFKKFQKTKVDTFASHGTSDISQIIALRAYERRDNLVL